MSTPWGKEFGQEIVQIIKIYVAEQMATRDARIAELEKALAALTTKRRRTGQ